MAPHEAHPMFAAHATVIPTRHASRFCKPGSMATAPSIAHHNRTHSCTSTRNSSFAEPSLTAMTTTTRQLATVVSTGNSRFDMRRPGMCRVCMCLDRCFPDGCNGMRPGRRWFGGRTHLCELPTQFAISCASFTSRMLKLRPGDMRIIHTGVLLLPACLTLSGPISNHLAVAPLSQTI